MKHASTCTQPPSLPLTAPADTLAATTEQLQIPPGQAVWFYMEGGSSLYCTAGQIRICSPWAACLALHEGDAPYSRTDAGWHQLEALGKQIAQVHIIAPCTNNSACSAWRALLQWIGL